MAKKSSKYYCVECGYESAGYLGRCPSCDSWNTFVEETIKKTTTKGQDQARAISQVFSINDVTVEEETRRQTEIKELDRVLGGGIVKGSIVLVAGDPGIGKSTLMLMVAGKLARDEKLLYISGEESVRQIKMRASRLKVDSEKLFLVAETNMASIIELIEKEDPKYLVIDSIQTLYDDDLQSAPGSVSQVREATNTLMQIAKSKGISVFIVGHVTKEGSIAGPRVLEHMVDTVLYFEGERQQAYRILRGVKNRFGSTNEIGVFEMGNEGLIEVENPSLALLAGRPVDSSGTCVACTMEGTRPMLVEVQALVTKSAFMNGKRMATGIDVNRLSLLLAVMEKRLGYKFSDADVYVNIIGGIKINEPAIDLAIVAAIMSSYRDINIDPHMVFFGEVGLTGEIRSASQADKRVAEALRLGFTKCLLPFGNKKKLESHGENIYPLESIKDLNRLFSNWKGEIS